MTFQLRKIESANERARERESERARERERVGDKSTEEALPPLPERPITRSQISVLLELLRICLAELRLLVILGFSEILRVLHLVSLKNIEG